MYFGVSSSCCDGIVIILMYSLVNVGKEEVAVTVEDFNYLNQLVEVTDGGPSWIPMMNRSTASMSYRAWRRDPEVS